MMRRLFRGAPAEYDSLLSLLTLRSDSSWRKAVVKSSNLSAKAFVLDVATGTGLMALDFANQLSPDSLVVGVDLCEPMLLKGKANLERDQKRVVDFVEGRAEALPFVDGCFDCAAITLALRNVTEPKTTFEEMRRVVRTGGSVVSMDFSRPSNQVFARIYNFHIFHVLPFFGRLVSPQWREIFEYLAGSIKRSMDPATIGDLMRGVGLSNVSIRRLSMGIVSVVEGSKRT
jgi:demethylmenaquinone methyltransferase/2-methoxy-6-polyprenyl-1,4-benzoquinol methylase